MKRNTRIILILALIFLAPGIMAYLFYSNPEWLKHGSTNRGTLLPAPLLITDLANDIPPKISIPGIKTQAVWRLILWSPSACNHICLQQLDTLARIRLALGRRLYEVVPLLLLQEGAPSLKSPQLNALDDRGIHVLTIPPQPLLPHEPQIFIADPNHYLVLSYPLNAVSEDIFQDLKHMLTSTHKPEA